MENKRGQERSAGIGVVSMQPDEIDQEASLLSSLEMKLLEIAKRLMAQHYLLDTHGLYRSAIRELASVSPVEIQNAIDHMVRMCIFFDKSALTRDEILENPTRRSMFDMIAAQPGIKYSHIRDTLAIDPRTTSFHLNVLIKFKFIRLQKFDNSTTFFAFSLENKYDFLYFLLQKSNMTDILRVILPNQPIILEQVVQMMEKQASRATILRKLKLLLEKNVLIGGPGNPPTVQVNENFKAFIEKLLN